MQARASFTYQRLSRHVCIEFFKEKIFSLLVFATRRCKIVRVGHRDEVQEITWACGRELGPCERRVDVVVPLDVDVVLDGPTLIGRVDGRLADLVVARRESRGVLVPGAVRVASEN